MIERNNDTSCYRMLSHVDARFRMSSNGPGRRYRQRLQGFIVVSGRFACQCVVSVVGIFRVLFRCLLCIIFYILL